MVPAPFLAALQTAVADLRATVQARLVPLSPARLNQRPAPGSWSALECIEHLNRYSRYYNTALTKVLPTLPAPASCAHLPVQYTWLGRKSITLVQPSNASKQTTLQRMNPLGSRLSHETLAEFDQHQAELLRLLAQAHAADLNRKAVPIEFIRLLRLRVGEALEFVVRHQERHVQQALRTQAALPSGRPHFPHSLA